MNRFGTLIAWAQGFLNHTALPSIATFIANILHDELDVAERLVKTIIDSIPQDLAASKPLVALGAVAMAAGEQAVKEGLTVGTNAIAVASANAVAFLAGSLPVTEVDPTGAMNAVENERASAIAAINKEADAKKAALQTAAEQAAAELKAKVSN